MNLSAIAMLYFGIPYTFGGNNPATGLDCSGLVVECLRSIGKHGKSDLNAQMIYDEFKEESIHGKVTKDSILFFGRDFDSISHIAIALDDNLMIEAGGEGRNETDTGYVRIRPISWRRDYLTSINL